MHKVLHNACKSAEMVTTEARNLIIEVAGPRRLGENIKSQIAAVARRLGWDFARTMNIYHGRARVIRAEEWIRLNEEAAALRESAKKREEALHALDVLAARVGIAPARQVDGPADLASDAGEPSLPFSGELDAD